MSGQQKSSQNPSRKVDRGQTGVRIEKRMLKVLKGLAEFHDMAQEDLLEGIVLHVFDGKVPFDKKNMKIIHQMRSLYELNLTYEDSHNLVES